MSHEVAQNIMILVGYGVGVVILCGVLIYVRRVEKRVKQLQQQINLIDKAHQDVAEPEVTKEK